MLINSVITRNNVNISGQANGPVVILAHGFGCDQNMWRFIQKELERDYKVLLFDYVGSGNSVLSSYSIEKYATLDGYAQDIIDIIDALALRDVTIIGHSVSGTIAAIASMQVSASIAKIVMVCPSPCFLNLPPDYFGGFDKSDLEELLDLMDKNYIGWANYLAPLVMGSSHSGELIGELSGSFCSTDPIVAKAFAKATFFSDHRALLNQLTSEVLILQSAHDSLAHVRVGKFMAESIANSHLSIIEAEGHCLHITNHQDILPIIQGFLN